MKRPRDKVVPVVALRINGKLYRTPEAAANAWAYAAWVRTASRRWWYHYNNKTGLNQFTDNDWHAIPVIKNYHNIAYSRAYPIFKAFFERFK